MKTILTVLMLVMFAVMVACGSTAATTGSEGKSATTVMGIQNTTTTFHIPHQALEY